MPIRVPSLDDRSFQNLVDEVLARVPAHTPEWTNPVPGDPGRTLVELFAWLTDTLLYRVNLIPERQRLAFLRLLGVQMWPARSARTLVTINFDAPENTLAQFLPAQTTKVKGATIFEVRSEVTVLPLVGEAYRKRPLTPEEGNEMSDKIAQLSRLYPIDKTAKPYLTTPVFPGGKADPAGFDLIQHTVDHALWFALLAPLEEADDFTPAIDAVKTTLGQSSSGGPQYLNVGFSPKLTMPAFDEDIGERAPIPMTWELTTPDPAKPKEVAYLPLTVVSDTTQGYTTDGIVRLGLPSKASFFAPSNNVRDDFAAGVGDKPPRLDDVNKAARLVAWLRLKPATDLDSLAISWAGINAAEVDHRQTTAGLIVGQGNGQPDQVLGVTNDGGVEAETFSLQVEEAGLGYRRWRRIDDLALAGVQEAVFELDAEEGKVYFGNGVQGRIPARGARFRVETMRIGGGDAGNLGPGSLTQVQIAPAPVAKLKVHQPLAATGGQNAETLEQAEKRIPALFRNRDRAVTEDDYKQIAATTPGVQVGRVEVLPRFKPQGRRPDVPGVVSVMALPYRAGFDAPYPRIDRPFVETVYKRLSDRKPLGTELYVIGCEYIPIAISVGIDNPGGREETNTAVKDALKRYLFCLPPGGPQSRGWPLGRTVKRRELEIVVSRVEGVMGVYGPNLFRQVGGAWQRITSPGGDDNVEMTLLGWQLPELIGVVVAEGAAPTEFKPPAPTKANDGVAIPVVPEVC